MKRIFLGLAAALVSVPVWAADMPAPAPRIVYSAAPVASWTGCYLGVQGGWARATSNSISGHIDGGLAGGQAGCNWQTSANWVWGLETEMAWVDIKEGDPAIARLKSDWLGSTRLRAGISSSNAWLYATGGVGYGHAEISLLGAQDSNTHVGWVAGGGIEWMLSTNWTGKVEYLHYGLGKETYFGVASLDYNVDTVKVGLNYKFGY